MDNLKKLNPNIWSHLVILVPCKLCDEFIKVASLGNQQALIDRFSVSPVFQGFCLTEENLCLFLGGRKLARTFVCYLLKQAVKRFCSLVVEGFTKNKKTGKYNGDNEDSCNCDLSGIAPRAPAGGLSAPRDECRGGVAGWCSWLTRGDRGRSNGS